MAQLPTLDICQKYFRWGILTNFEKKSVFHENGVEVGQPDGNTVHRWGNQYLISGKKRGWGG